LQPVAIQPPTVDRSSQTCCRRAAQGRAEDRRAPSEARSRTHQENDPMSLSMYSMTVGQCVPMLKNLHTILEKAEAFATAKKLEPGVLEGLRLAPDMLSFARQVQLASDFAKNSAARLAGVEPPKFEDTEKTLADLKIRVAKTIDYLNTLAPAQFAGAETRHIVLPLRTRTLEMDGLPFLQNWVLPNFFFHVTTAYALLRHVGVEVGKRDFLGGV
jgi:hypothetical protein